MIVITRMITRELVQRNPGTLFVFGDNMAGTGLGGQAKEMRGEPNAVGIPTKHAPTTDDAAYFTDADFERVKPVILARFQRLRDHHRSGGRVVWPAAGVGSGRAELAKRAPKICLLIEWLRAQMMCEGEVRGFEGLERPFQAAILPKPSQGSDQPKETANHE